MVLGDGSTGRLRLLCICGMLLSSLAIAVQDNKITSLLHLASYLLYHALKTAMSVFFNMQWDALLLEAGLLSFLLCTAHTALAKTVCLLLFQVLLFRLMFGSGIVKITSRDQSWRSLTAMSYHFWTQPLPGVLAPYFHALPLVVTKCMTLVTLITETLVPLLSIVPPMRSIGFVLYSCLQLSITATGNFGFFNLLSAVLGLCLLRDKHFELYLSPSVLSYLTILLPPMAETHLANTATDFIVILLAIIILMSNVVAIQRLCNRLVPTNLSLEEKVQQLLQKKKRSLSSLVPSPVKVPKFLDSLHSYLEPLCLGQHYGLFASMTKTRDEIIIEISASSDGQWTAVPFAFKPGSDLSQNIKPVSFPPCHMPRLDWNLWFLALQQFPESSIPQKKWFMRLLRGILMRDRSILSLLGSGVESILSPSTIQYVRVKLIPFHFTLNFVSGPTWTSSSSNNVKDGETKDLLILPPSTLADIEAKLSALEVAAAAKEAELDKQNAQQTLRGFVAKIKENNKAKVLSVSKTTFLPSPCLEEK